MRFNPLPANNDNIRYLIRFIRRLNHCYWERNNCLNIKICKLIVSIQTHMSNFQPLEVVDRGSEPQPQVVEHLNKFKKITSAGYYFYITINVQCTK